ncbi:ATP-binding protein [Rhodoferax sp. U11-2br]|uniref:ATP-binding protein n=1 Tax=Rhodoferax sp. U11-2br TaxID=2838878 RepID=UPI001BEBDE89|nr:AAA family ATPase [Rhodoferax sp. U11-2br]MBT3066967.1 AAA family ATPase [Rhodoferax sp. U11-2br]
MTFQRSQVYILQSRLQEAPQFITIVTGPRQVGKTTLVRQALAGCTHYFVAVDQPAEARPFTYSDFSSPFSEVDGAPRDAAWLIRRWQEARQQFKTLQQTRPQQTFAFVLDEIQKVPRWSDTIKGLWDADRAQGLDMHVILLGSSPLLLQKGLTESLAGRYELIRVMHWSYLEMHQAFDFTLNEYIYFGGYPGAARLIRDEARWRNYVLASLVQPSIDTDILQMTRVDKPALLKQLFELGASYSGQLLALGKVKGQLQDAGNETTLAGYLTLLSNAGLLTGLHKYHVGAARKRASAPKFNVLNTALMSSATPYTLAQAQADRSYWGRLVESAVGAHLWNTAESYEDISYWRESPHEVDFVITDAVRMTAIEVKSAAATGQLRGLEEFCKQHPHCKRLLVGAGGVDLTEFLSYPLAHWLDTP